MVEISEIQRRNAEFAERKPADQVAVFVGATAGIGENTTKTLVTLLERPHFIIIGRSRDRFEAQRKQLLALNRSATITFVQAEVSRLTEVDRACSEILASNTRIDYLCMSAGYLPVGGAVTTPEGLELGMQLSVYSRIRFIHRLLPALLQSPHPRILSVLGAGKEGQMNEADLGLDENFSLDSFMKHTTTLTTLNFEYFDRENPGKLTLVHSAPGLVKSNIASRKQVGDTRSGFLWSNFVVPVMRRAFDLAIMLTGISVQEAGERQAELLTSERFTPGVWRTDPTGEIAPKIDALEKYRAEGWVDTAWEFTAGVWRRVLGNGA